MVALTLWRVLILMTTTGIAYFIWKGLTKGTVELRPGLPTFDRRDQPRLYWLTLAFWSAMLMIAVLSGFKTWNGEGL